MAQPVIQSSFNSGEWAPHLWARVDVQKYHSGAALLRNFFVDYRGGVSTRVGTKYILQAYKSTTAVRLIPFQASLALGYVLEFGDQYIRFHKNGAPVLEAPIAITGATRANPCVLSVVNSWSPGDWVYVTGVAGMTQLNGRYFIVHAATGTTATLYDLFGNPVDATAYGAWTSGGTAARVYTISSPYLAADLALIKFAQNVDALILCHPSYQPYTLTYVANANWLLAPISFGTTVTAPTGVVVSTTLNPSLAYYAYCVTAVDANGQESQPSAVAYLNGYENILTTVGTNTISWTSVTGAVSYNVYRAALRISNQVAIGVPFGFIGNCTSNIFTDSNIAPDFSTAPPEIRNPFAPGASVGSATVTAPGSYTTVPSVVFAAAPAGGITATGTLDMYIATATKVAGGAGYAVNDTLTFAGGNGILKVTGVSGGAITSVSIVNAGVWTGALPSLPISQSSSSGAGTGATFNLTWGVLAIVLTNVGQGYLVAPAITFGAGAATATAVLSTLSAGNPSVPAFFQQRLVLAGPNNSPQTLFMSQPGEYYNYNVSNPVQSDDSITASIVSGQLSNIKALVPVPSGLIVFTDGISYLINGGSLGTAVSPSAIVANAQSYLGCNDMPPIVSNYDILTVQSKGSSVRDSSYNFYANIFTGSDVSILASHLFFGYKLMEWAWAEEPYKVVWAVRNDGTMLHLTFLKEQEFIGWSHSDTTGLFKSVATIVEPATVGYQNFVYTVVQRTVGGQSLQYVEYFPERIYTNGVTDAICVDACATYSGAPATVFTGANHLAGLTCTGLADGVIIPAFTMAANGSFTLTTPASKVSIGLAFTAQLKTLYLDTGDPTIQSKMKKIPASTVRVTETLGLKIGTTFNDLVDMKDLVRGNVGTMTNEIVTDLVTGDARTFLDTKWQTQGVFCISQPYPYPATILGVVPQLTVGDTPK